MRNLFDQYDAPENRLTHAPGCCLQRDPRLLRDFVRRAVGRGTTPIRPRRPAMSRPRGPKRGNLRINLRGGPAQLP